MSLLLLRPLPTAFADVEGVPGGAEEPSVRTALVLFAALALLLLLFLAGVALLALSRSRRRGHASDPDASDPDASDPEAVGDEAPADAWTEAGRRARAFPSPPRDD